MTLLCIFDIKASLCTHCYFLSKSSRPLFFYISKEYENPCNPNEDRQSSVMVPPPRAAEEAACSNPEVGVEGEASSRLWDLTAKATRFPWDHHHTGQELEFVRAWGE